MKPPHHLSEGLFRYFEPHLAEAVKNWPLDTEFDLTRIPAEDRYATATFVARFRDSILSLRRYKWQTSLIDMEKFAALLAAADGPLKMPKYFITSTDENHVWFRNRDNLGVGDRRVHHSIGRANLPTLASSPLASSAVLHKDITEEELLAFVVLLAGKRISGPIRVATQVAEETAQSLMAQWDVAFTWDEREKVMVIT